MVLASYETTLSQKFALIFFVPIIMAMGGNSGIQSSVIVIRGLATGEISTVGIRRRFFREMRVSLFIGFLFGVAIAILVGLYLQNNMMGIMIGIALNAVILQATLCPRTTSRETLGPSIYWSATIPPFQRTS